MKSQRTRIWWALIVVLLLTTTAMRTAQLESIPPGLTHDEAGNGYDATRILEGKHQIYLPTGYGREPLYQYSVAVSMWLFDQGVFALRITTVFWSLITWICTVAIARKWWGRIAALTTGASMTASFWALMMSRVGLRGPVLPALLAASALAYAHGLSGKTRSSGKPTDRTCLYFIASGLLLGLSLYTYMASRGMPLLYLGFLLVLVFTQRSTARRIWVSTLLVVALAILVAMPLILHLRAHPALELRVGQLAGGINQALQGDFSVLIKNFTDSLPMLFWRADPQWLYNIAGRAALEPVLAILFIIGVILLMIRFRERRSVFTLIWLLGGLAPAFLTSEWYNTLHAIAAMPAIFLIIGSASAWLVRRLAQLKITAPRRRAITFIGTLFVITGVYTVGDYFNIWAEQSEVNTLYHRHTYELARTLDEDLPTNGVAVIGTQYPNKPHDPYIFDNLLTRDDITIRYVDTRYALFIPQQPATFTLNTDQQEHLNTMLAPFILPYLHSENRLMWPGHLPDAVDIYAWNAPATWDTLSAAVQSTVILNADGIPLGDSSQSVELPLNFGQYLTLTGYHVEGILRPGATVKLLTLWSVNQPVDGEWKLFTHVISNDETIITQVDKLDAPSWQWQSGDRFAQVHTLYIPADAPVGVVWLATGVFESTSWQRLSITEDSTRIFIRAEITE